MAARWPVVLVVIISLLIAAWYRERAPMGPVAAAPVANGPARPLPADVHTSAAALPPATPGRRQLLANYRLAERTLCSYAQASQYPPGSRPMAQNADQA